MQTLNAHLRQTEAHDGLPFHTGCPICRETRAIGRLRRKFGRIAGCYRIERLGLHHLSDRAAVIGVAHVGVGAASDG